MIRISDHEQKCAAPKSDNTGDVKLELSANGQQYHDSGKTLTFYDGPRVVSVSPTYGVTKNPKDSSIVITGENFHCPKGDCSKIKVRFTNARGD